MTGSDTRLISSGRPKGDRATVNPPTERGSTTLFSSARDLYAGGARGYGRMGLSTHRALEETLCAVNGAERVVLTPSGLSACTLALLAFLKPGDHALIVDSAYSPTRRFCDQVLAARGVEITYYPPRIGAEIAARFKPNTRVLYLESPGSLTFEVQDTPALTAAARSAGVITIIDDTWSAGLLFQPLGHGVDVAAQALTKYASGHSDVLMGAIMTRSPQTAAPIEALVRDLGVAPGPDDAALVLRGLRTLPVRMERSAETGLALAQWLEGQPQIAQVLHPALQSSPDHALWRRDFSGAAGLFSVTLTRGGEAEAVAFLDALRRFGLGFSWGGFESLAIWCDPQLTRTAVGWAAPGPLLRFSAGMETLDDLIADLERGLAALPSAPQGA